MATYARFILNKPLIQQLEILEENADALENKDEASRKIKVKYKPLYIHKDLYQIISTTIENNSFVDGYFSNEEVFSIYKNGQLLEDHQEIPCCKLDLKITQLYMMTQEKNLRTRSNNALSISYNPNISLLKQIKELQEPTSNENEKLYKSLRIGNSFFQMNAIKKSPNKFSKFKEEEWDYSLTDANGKKIITTQHPDQLEIQLKELFKLRSTPKKS